MVQYEVAKYNTRYYCTWYALRGSYIAQCLVKDQETTYCQVSYLVEDNTTAVVALGPGPVCTVSVTAILPV